MTEDKVEESVQDLQSKSDFSTRNQPLVQVVNMTPELKTTKAEKMRLELIYHLNDAIKEGKIDFVKHFGMEKDELIKNILENNSEEDLIELAQSNDKIVEHYSNLSKQKVLNKLFTELHP